MSSYFMVSAMEPSIGLLEGRPEFGFRFAATETPKGHWPSWHQTA